MTRQDYIKDQVERRWPEQFKNHSARQMWTTIHCDFIEWRNPDSWCYACRYIIQSQWLFAFGDLYEATYQWGEPITWQFLSGLNLDYFLGKMRASPGGRDWNSWCDEVALDGLSSTEYYPNDIADKLVRQGWFPSDAKSALLNGSKDNVDSVARTIYEETGDAEWASAIRSVGEVPDTMAIGHFVGLKMAWAQLQSKKDKELP